MRISDWSSDVCSSDLANATCTVKSGDIVTGELPWVAQRAGRIRHWCPPTEGEQFLLLCPEGDIENGLVIVGLYSAACPAPSTSPDLSIIDYPDGAVISYDFAAHSLKAILPPGGPVALMAEAGGSISRAPAATGKITAYAV